MFGNDERQATVRVFLGGEQRDWVTVDQAAAKVASLMGAPEDLIAEGLKDGSTVVLAGPGMPSLEFRPVSLGDPCLN